MLTNSSHGVDDIGFHLINRDLPLAEPQVERVEVKVARDILKKYVGEYELTPDFSIVVTRKRRALFVKLPGRRSFPVK